MTHIDVGSGVTGAKRQSMRANPRLLLQRLMDENPGSPKAEIRELFMRQVEINENDYVDTMKEYWFTNNYQCISKPVSKGPRPPAAASSAFRSAADAIKESVSSHVDRRARVLLLDMILPNGKAVRDVTKGECMKLGPRIGAWLTKVGKKMKVGQKVGDIFSEEQVRAIYDA